MSSSQTIQPNQTAVENESKPKFPPNVVIYIRRELDIRSQYKRELEKVPVYSGYMQVRKRKIEDQRGTLEQAIAKLTKDIVAIANKHLPDIEIDPDNDEITIANILAVLPAPEEVVIKKVYHGMHGPASE